VAAVKSMWKGGTLMKRMALLILPVVALLFAVACCVANYVEDFSEKRDWFSEYWKSTGVVEMSVSERNVLYRCESAPSEYGSLEVGDTIEVDLTFVTCESGGGGLFVMREDGSAMGVQIDPDGWYETLRRRPNFDADMGSYTYRIETIDSGQSFQINKGLGVVNHLSFEMKHGMIDCYCNGQRLTTLRTSMQGDLAISLSVSNYEKTTTVRFDNLVVPHAPSGAPSLDSAREIDLTVLDEDFYQGLGSTLFQDDFSSQKSGWEIEEYSDGSQGYQAREYAINIDEPNMIFWGVAPAEEGFPADFVVEVDAYKLSGPADGSYGISWGKDDDNFYLFTISADGWYVLDKQLNGEWQDAPVPLAKSPVINQESSLNHLVVIVSGALVSVAVNDVILKMVTASNFGAC